MEKEKLDLLVANYVAAKDKMALCSGEVDRAFEALLPHLQKIEEGTTHTYGQNYDIVTSYKLTIKIDDKVLPDVEKVIPETVFKRVFTYKPTISVKEFKKIKEFNQEVYKKILPALTFSPAKASIEIKPIERN